eukprot:20725-Pelagomonas_calceolata.AAC.2
MMNPSTVYAPQVPGPARRVQQSHHKHNHQPCLCPRPSQAQELQQLLQASLQQWIRDACCVCSLALVHIPKQLQAFEVDEMMTRFAAHRLPFSHLGLLIEHILAKQLLSSECCLYFVSLKMLQPCSIL